MYLYKLNQLVDGTPHDEDAILLTHESPFTEDEFTRMFDRVAVHAMERAANRNPSILPSCYADCWMSEAAKLLCERYGFQKLRVHATTSFHSGRLDMGHDSGVYDERTAAVVKRAEEHGPVEHPKAAAERQARNRRTLVSDLQSPKAHAHAKNALGQLLVERILSENSAMDVLNPLKPVKPQSGAVVQPGTVMSKQILDDAVTKVRSISLPLYHRGPAITGVIL